MKKCLFGVIIIYLLYIWMPPFITILFPINDKKVVGNYILSSCTSSNCSFYNIHFNKNNELSVECIDSHGEIKSKMKNKWEIKNGHRVVLDNKYDDFSFPRFGDIHRNLFFPWIIKIETSINGKCEFEQWNFATKL